MATRAWFRTRGGPTHGWGNVFRLAAVAEACRARGLVDLRFLVEGPPEVHVWLRRRGFTVTELVEEVSVDAESEVLSALGRADLIIMEMLEVTWSRQAMLREHCNRLVVFDDLCDHTYCADLVVVGQGLPNTANQDLSAPHTRFLSGWDYFLNRPEFEVYRDRLRVHRPEVSRILVTLGGGRYDVGYLKAAHALRRLGSSVTPTFVLGYANHGRLADAIGDLVPWAEVLAGVDDMPARLWETDLAIVSAGYSKIEAAFTGTPALMVSAQWHQIPLAETFSQASGMPDLGYMSYVSVDALEAALRRLLPEGARRAAAQRARGVVDGHGVDRVLQEVLEPASQNEEHS